MKEKTSASQTLFIVQHILEQVTLSNSIHTVWRDILFRNSPSFALPKASLNIAGFAAVGWVCWCFKAFILRLATGGSRFRLGCSTGNTRRRRLGSFDRALAQNYNSFENIFFQ